MGTNLSISPQGVVILHLRQSKFKSMGKGTNFSGQPVLSQLIIITGTSSCKQSFFLGVHMQCISHCQKRCIASFVYSV